MEVMKKIRKTEFISMLRLNLPSVETLPIINWRIPTKMFPAAITKLENAAI